MKQWCVYILRCGDGTLYTGSTDDFLKRLRAHKQGKGAKYTRGRSPLEPVYIEPCAHRSAALKREYAIKHLSRLEKLELISRRDKIFIQKQGVFYMYITDNIFYVGVNDHKTDLFEGQYVVPNGIAYNSYVIRDEKIAVMDTVDIGFTEEWLGKIHEILDGRKPDYLVIHHMEPDHAGSIARFMEVYPETTIVSNSKSFVMMDNFFPGQLQGQRLAVEEGSTLSLGRHCLNFVAAPMVHWPEVLVSYESTEKILFSADAFGKFGALDVEEPWVDEARRYYIGIVGKYGIQATAVLKKAATLDISMICATHGPILKENLGYYVEKYLTWASYAVEEEGIVVAYSSIYGNTKKAALLLADKLRELGAPAVVVYDLARCDMAQAVADAFRYSKLVLASPTYNAEVFPHMRNFLSHLTERNFRYRTVGLIENGSWAPRAAKVMKDHLEKAKELVFCENVVSIRSALNRDSMAQLDALAEELCKEYQKEEV